MILFELGNGDGACLCVEKKRWTGRRFPFVYWYSKFFQVHKLAIWPGIVITWRLRAFVWRTTK